MQFHTCQRFSVQIDMNNFLVLSVIDIETYTNIFQTIQSCEQLCDDLYILQSGLVHRHLGTPRIRSSSVYATGCTWRTHSTHAQTYSVACRSVKGHKKLEVCGRPHRTYTYSIPSDDKNGPSRTRGKYSSAQGCISTAVLGGKC